MKIFDRLNSELIVLCLLVLVLMWYYVRQKWKYFEYIVLPYVKPKLSHLGSMIPSLKDMMFDAKCKAEHGLVYGQFNLATPVVTVGDPDILRQIYIKEFQNFPIRRTMFSKSGRELNYSLTAVNTENWKRTRSTITPIFSSFKLKQMHGILLKCANTMVHKLDGICKDKSTFDVKEVFGDFSLDIVLSAVFNTQVQGSNGNEESEAVAQAKKFFDISAMKSPLVILIILFPWLENITSKLGLTINDKGCLDYFKQLSLAIKRRRIDCPDETNRIDIMQLMLNAEILEEEIQNLHSGKGLTHNEIIGNAMLMIVAGYENTANTAGFLAYNLAVHPNIQKRLQEEIDAAVGEEGEISYSILNEMKYLEMCLNESMRLYCPILRNARICVKDTVINGVSFKKGVEVSIPALCLHRDPEYWEEPLEFRPGRMEDMNKIDPMVFQPFGAGPRNCIAMRFAKNEVKIAIASILMKYNIRPTANTPKPPLELQFKSSVMPKEPIHLKLEERS